MNSVTLGPILDQTWTRTALMRFRLDIEGFGLTSLDTLRLISSDRTCTDDSGDPTGVDRTIQWNCPDIDAGCVDILSSDSVNIPLVAKSWDCVDIDEYNTCLGSSVSITSLVTGSGGYVTITFAADPGLQVGDYIKFGSGITCGTNCVSTQLNMLLAGPFSSVTDEFIIGHLLLLNPSGPANTFRIHVTSFSVASLPQFVITGGVLAWYKTSDVSTRIELLGQIGRAGIKVCWNGGGKSGGYTVQAGILTVVDPNLVLTGGIYPVSSDPELVDFPLVIEFTTSASSLYDDTPYGSSFVFQVTNPAVLALWVPSPGSVDCGQIFSELWAFRAEFPQPIECIVHVFTIATEVTGVEIQMMFAPSNGLWQNTKYQFVVTASVLVAESVRSVETTPCCGTNDCDTAAAPAWQRGCHYMVISTLRADSTSVQNPSVTIDVARVGLTASLAQPFGSAFTRVVTMPYVGAADIQGTDPLELTRSTDSLLIEFSGGNGVTTGSIVAGSILRMIFYPLTSWRVVESVCLASIIASGPGIAYTGSIPVCMGESVVAAGQKNVIRLELPTNLPAVDGADWIRVQINGIGVPMTGFFPQAIGVEISRPSPWSSKYILSTRSRLWKQAERGVARIMRTDLVTESSFKAATNQELIVEVKTDIAVSIGSALVFQLPADYTCISVSESEIAGMGVPPAETWPYAGSTCSVASTTVAICDTVFLGYKIVVNFPLVASAPTQFFLEITSPSAEVYSLPFWTPRNDPLWVSEISILGSIVAQRIVPLSSWAWSSLTSTDQAFAFFFIAEQSIFRGGAIRITLPSGYTAPTTGCTAINLAPSIYYAGETPGAFRLPGLVSACSVSGLQITVEFTGNLVGGRQYAFEFVAKNPVVGVLVKDRTVVVRTIDREGVMVDGSDSILIGDVVTFTSTLSVASPTIFVPFSKSLAKTSTTLSFTESKTTANCKIVAPAGFIINDNTVVASSVGSWSIGTASLLTNELNLISLVTVSYTSISFTILVTVPDRSPSGINRWRIEFSDLIAVSSPNTMVAGLVNGAAIPGSTVSGALHMMYFTIRLISPANSFFINVPSDLLFDTSCIVVPIGAVSGFFDESTSCSYLNDQIALTHSVQVPAGEYMFLIQARNPGLAPLVADAGAPCGFSRCFGFETDADLALWIPGFGYQAEMVSGGIVADTVGRDDRPGHWNELVLTFATHHSLTSLTITAPPGFEFELDCLPDVVFAVSALVFNDGRPWNTEHFASSIPVSVTSCWGDPDRRETASLTLSGSLPAGSYPMRIALRNPLEMDVRDQWTIHSDDEAIAFQTFMLNVFDSPEIARNAIGYPDVYTVNTFLVSPSHAIPVDGSLVFYAPSEVTLPETICESVSFGAFSFLCDTGCQVSGCSVNLTMQAFVDLGTYNATLLVIQTASVPGTWTVSSYDAGGAGLDESTVSSLETLVPAPTVFSVTGTAYGREQADFNIQFEIPSSVTAGQTIRVDAPVGYNFTSDCLSLVFVDVEFDTANTCVGSRIEMVVGTTISSQLIRLTVSGTNAASTPFPSNLFILSVIDNEAVILSGTSLGWPIVPQLANVAVAIHNGPNYGIGSISNISIYLTTVSSMNRIVFEFPEFDFSKSVLNFTQIDKDSHLWVPVSSGTISAGMPFITIPLLSPLEGRTELSLMITSAVLGPVPGNVLVNIMTYIDTSLRDARMEFTGARIADLITITNKTLLTDSILAAPKISDFFIPRTSESSLLSFEFLLETIPIESNSQFKISSAVFDFQPNVSLWTVYNVSTNTHLLYETVYVPINNLTVTDQLIRFRVGEDISTTQKWTLEIAATAPAEMSRSRSNFLISVFPLRSQFPSHTNDNTTSGFSVVNPVVFEIMAPRSPPSARITVGLQVYSVGDLIAYSLLVIAPVGFEFDCTTQCTESGVYDGRNSAYVFFTDGLVDNPTTSASLTPGLELSVITPLVSAPTDNNWVVIANGLAGVETGWGMLQDVFEVEPMNQVAIQYAKTFSTFTQVAVSFENKVKIESGGKIRVYYPNGFQFDCTSFNKVTLPIYTSSSWDELCRLNLAALNTSRNDNLTVAVTSDSFDISLLEDLVPGEFSFTLLAKTPSVLTDDNLFTVLLLTSENDVIDSYIDYPGIPLVSTIHVELVSGFSGFEWYPSIVVGGSKMTIEIFFTVVDQISLIGGKIPINSITVFYPAGFSNAMIELSEIVAPIGIGIEISNEEALRVRLDTSQKILKGIYSIKFPVFVPEMIPDVNIWNVAFCQGVCLDPGDAVVSLPLGGFLMGAQHPYTRLLATSDSSETTFYIFALLLIIY